MKSISNELKQDEELEKWYICIAEDIDKLEKIFQFDKWDDIYEYLNQLSFDTWPTKRNFVSEVKDKAKIIRDKAKESILTGPSSIKNKIFIYKSHQANLDIYAMYQILKEIQEIIIKFSNEYRKSKLEKNIIDFNDIEHLALQNISRKKRRGRIYTNRCCKKLPKNV